MLRFVLNLILVTLLTSSAFAAALPFPNPPSAEWCKKNPGSNFCGRR